MIASTTVGHTVAEETLINQAEVLRYLQMVLHAHAKSSRAFTLERSRSELPLAANICQHQYQGAQEA